jgi:hypothetical protein
MDEKDNLQKIRGEYPEFFSKISDDLMAFIFSETTAARIADICIRNGIKDDEKIEAVSYRITMVLLKRLPKNNLAYTLESGAGISKETAQKISSETEKIIFSDTPSMNPEEEHNKKPQPLPRETAEQEKETKQPPKGKDTYREKVE